MSKICPKCGTTNYESASKCVHCGGTFQNGIYGGMNSAEQKNAIDKSSKILIAVIAIIVCLIIALVVVFAVSNSSNSNNVQQSTAPVSQNKSEGTSKKLSNNIITGGTPGEAENFGDDYVPIESITVSENEITLYVGESYQLYGYIYPDNASNQGLEWFTDDYDVCTVDEYGVITAVGPGLGYVGCYSTSEDRDDFCKVNVIEEDEFDDYDESSDDYDWE